jgi:hypothetical protein
MMNGGMDSMMPMMWVMGLGLVGWMLVIGLLVAILIVLVRLLHRLPGGGAGENQRERRYDKPLQER